MDNDKLQRQLEEYAKNCDEIRLLTAVRTEGESAESYRDELTRDYLRIGELGRRNREILKSSLEPLLETEKSLSPDCAAILQNFCILLLEPESGVELDLMLLHRVSSRLVDEFERAGDGRALARQLNMHISTCYSIINMTSRVSGSRELSEKYLSDGLRAAARAVEILGDKERFKECGSEGMMEILRAVRFYSALYDTYFHPDETNELRLKALTDALKIADDPWYRETVEGYDWTRHVTRCIEHMGQMTERGNRWGLSRDNCELIWEHLERLRQLWESDERVKELLPEAHYRLILIRNAWLSGRSTTEDYRRGLIEIYDRFADSDYDMYSVQTNLLIPAEYLLTLKNESDISSSTEEVLRRMYRKVTKYILDSVNRDAFNFMQEYLIGFLDAFIEIPGVMTMREMVTRSMAALHSPTYIHSSMTARLARCLASHLLIKEPERFIGVCGALDASEVAKSSCAIKELAYKAGMLHDTGVLVIIDTITVYGRELCDDEREIIKLHPVIGAELLRRHESTRDVADRALRHHLYYDGKGGYPAKMLSDSSRDILDAIVSLADSIDAATDAVGRSYRETLELETFVKEALEGSGTRYAPCVAELLKDESVLDDIRYLLGEGRSYVYRETRRLLRRVRDNARADSDETASAELKAMKAMLATEDKYISAARLITNDMETVSPESARAAQGDLAAFMENQAFKVRDGARYVGLLEKLRSKRDKLSEWDGAMVDRLWRRRLMEKNITPKTALRFSLTEKKAYFAWDRAREASDFSLFSEELSEVVNINRERCRLRELTDEESARMKGDYDMLLDLFERGMDVATLDPVFSECAERLKDITRRIVGSGKRIRTDFLSRPVPAYKEGEAADYIMDTVGFDKKRGAFAFSSHAYTERMAKSDVRITSMIMPGSFISNIYSVLHESGHALFEQLQPEKNYEYFLADAKTLGMHESVSRFYENIIGRSEAFIALIYPRLKEIFPDALSDVSQREFYEAVNLVEPTLIRTEADEVTYSLHVIIRYELEKRLFAGELTVDELPEAWNDLYYEYLGIRPKNDAEGVLQDVHWTSDFGYFPTYLLGNLYGAMYYEVMQEEIDVDSCVRAGDFKTINEWMKRHVFEKADRLTPSEWIRGITGRELTAEPFLNYISGKYGELYGLNEFGGGLDRKLEGYVRRMVRIRLLSSPKLSFVSTADAYRAALSDNFKNIGQLAGENRRVVDDVIDPILSSDEPLPEHTVSQIKALNENLMDAWTQENIDLPVAAMLSGRLMRDAEVKGDMDYMVRQLDEEISSCYALIEQTRRIVTKPEITLSIRERGLKALDRILKFLDKESFSALSPESKRLVLINTRYGFALYHTMIPLSAEDRAARMKLLEDSWRISEDKWYREAAPDYDWDNHRYRVCSYYSEMDEFGNCAGNSDEELETVADYGELMEKLWLTGKGNAQKQDRYSYVHAHTLRNMFHAGRVKGHDYRVEILKMYGSRERGRYDLDEIIDNIELPMEYIAALDREALTEEQRGIITDMYDSTLAYALEMPKVGVFYELMNYFAPIIFNFIEVPGGITFEDMCLKALAAFHPPTYIHSVMVAAISRRLVCHLIKRSPELLIGVCGCESAEEVVKRSASIESFVYHAALCHDFGKLLIIDTIFVYGRKILDFEFDIIRQHPELGAEFMARHVSTRELVDVARGHHRWYNNRGGYPDGFDTSASPLKTVIDLVACADCMDAATDAVGRSYRRGKSLAEFIDEVKAGAGTRYAPWLPELLDDGEVLTDLGFLLTRGRQENYIGAYLLLKDVQNLSEY